MTRRMLINAQVPEELRIAVVSGSTLEEYQVEVAERGLTRGNIYRGTIASIQPSLNAAFIDYGAERHGFLPIQDVVPEAYYRKPDKGGRPRIEDVLERGKPIVVQVVREAEGQKGGALTTNISIAGRYLVLTPFDDTRGISRKVDDEEIRKALRKHIDGLELEKGCGLIVRTNAIDQNKTALKRDLSALERLWKKVGTAARKGKGTCLLYSDQNLILQALRDYLDTSIGEVLVDSDEAFAKAEEYMKSFMPRSKTELVRYKERAPLFSKFDLEAQIEKIYQRRVALPGGGSIVIDPTEALTAIDVNSGKSTGAGSQAETAVHTNLEAAAEVARQLRLRDIGGLVVVDFIDMRNTRHQRKLEKELRDAMKADKARQTVGRISPNGLLEINRQRIQQALHIRTHLPCPTCDGTGHVPSPEMVALSLIRRIEARAAGGRLAKAQVALHPAIADAVQNGRRRQLAELEQEFDIKIEIISDPLLHRPEQEIDWTTRDPKQARPRTPRAIAPKVDSSLLIEPIEEDDLEDNDDEQEGGEDRSSRGPRRRGRRGGRRRRRGSEPDVTERTSDETEDEDDRPFNHRRSASDDEDDESPRAGDEDDDRDDDSQRAGDASEEDGDGDSDSDSDDKQTGRRRRRRRSRGGRSRQRRSQSSEDGDDSSSKDGDDKKDGDKKDDDKKDDDKRDDNRAEEPEERAATGHHRDDADRDDDADQDDDEHDGDEQGQAPSDDAETGDDDSPRSSRRSRGRRSRGGRGRRRRSAASEDGPQADGEASDSEALKPRSAQERSPDDSSDRERSAGDSEAATEDARDADARVEDAQQDDAGQDHAGQNDSADASPAETSAGAEPTGPEPAASGSGGDADTVRRGFSLFGRMMKRPASLLGDLAPPPPAPAAPAASDAGATDNGDDDEDSKDDDDDGYISL